MCESLENGTWFEPGVRNYRSVSFHVGENKENCLKNTEKLQVNAEQCKRTATPRRHFPLVFLSLSWRCRAMLMYKFILAFWMWPLMLPQVFSSLKRRGMPSHVAARGEQSWGWTASIRFLNNHKLRSRYTSLLYLITHAIGLSCREEHAKIQLLVWSTGKSSFWLF